MDRPMARRLVPRQKGKAMHEVMKLTFTGRKSKKGINEECNRIANDRGDYKGQLRGGVRFYDYTCDSRAEAENWIITHDGGWYDNLAVQYKDKGKTMWLVKIEYHC